MSIEAIAKASKVRELDSTTKFVLVALANYANDENVAYPKQQTIADFCNLKRQTVNKHLQILVKKGYILKQQRRFTSGANQGRQAPNSYLLVFKPYAKNKNSSVTLTDTTPNSCVTLNDSLSSVTFADTISLKGYIDKQQNEATDKEATQQATPQKKYTPIPLPDTVKQFLNKKELN